MATIESFEDLEIWKKSREINIFIYKIINRNPMSRDFKLVNQMNGSAGSIMDNIAEGFERGTKNEFIQFLGYAKGSCEELRSQLYRALDRKYITNEEFEVLKKMVVNISGLIQNLIKYLQKSMVAGVRKMTEPKEL